jgi:hypothetical protein
MSAVMLRTFILFASAAVAASAVCAACGSFDPAQPAPAAVADGGAEDGRVEAAPVGDGSGRFCETLGASAVICDDFDTDDQLSKTWRVSDTGGTFQLQTKSFSPPRSLRFDLAAGADCTGPKLDLSRAAPSSRGSVHLAARMNIDDIAGDPIVTSFNGGPSAELTGPAGACGFYVAWKGATPVLRVDVSGTDGGYLAVAHEYPMRASAMKRGEWFPVDLVIEADATTGTKLMFNAETHVIPECTGKDIEVAVIHANCADAQTSFAIDDFAVWLP